MGIKEEIKQLCSDVPQGETAFVYLETGGVWEQIIKACIPEYEALVASNEALGMSADPKLRSNYDNLAAKCADLEQQITDLTDEVASLTSDRDTLLAIHHKAMNEQEGSPPPVEDEEITNTEDDDKDGE